MTHDVVRLEGQVNGQTVLFEREPETDRWNAACPSVPDGTYVLELYAYDRWGNRSYYAKALYIADHKHLRIEFLEPDIGVLPQPIDIYIGE